MNTFRTYNKINSENVESIISDCFDICEENNELGIILYFENYALEVSFNNNPKADSPYADEDWDVILRDNFDGTITNSSEWCDVLDAFYSVKCEAEEEIPESIEIVYAY